MLRALVGVLVSTALLVVVPAAELRADGAGGGGEPGAPRAAAGGGAAADAAVIVPPAVVEQPDLVHPLGEEEARALGPAEVVVLLTVGEDGAVSDASLVEGESAADPRLREAALDVARRTRFSPATSGGVPLTVRLPLRLTFAPPPSSDPPLVDGLALDVQAQPLEPAATAIGERAAIGRSLAIGGALVLGASLLFTSFSGVTALDDAARREELAKTDEEHSAAARAKSYGSAMLVPVAGPFLAIASAPDASTILFTALGGAAHVAGLGLLAAGAGLILWPEPSEADVALVRE